MQQRLALSLLLTASLVAACTTDETAAPNSQTNTSDVQVIAPTDIDSGSRTDVVVPPQGLCDDIDPASCTLPWPSNHFLRYDPSRVTGYTLDFGNNTLPSNNKGKPIAGDMLARMDGYSVGTSIMAHFPNPDLTNAASERDLSPSLEKDHVSLLLEVGDDETLTQVPHWLEIDRRAGNFDEQMLFLRPGVILKPGTRYIVVFGDLRNMLFTKYERSPFMQKLFDREGGLRQPRFDNIFERLTSFGLKLEDITMTWDFVTASTQALHGTMIDMRDKALTATGSIGATIEITNFKENTLEEDEYIWLDIQATFDAPNFMKEIPVPGSTAYRFNTDESGNLVQNGWRKEPVWIRVPQSARGGAPHALVNYGHGQNGLGSQVKAGHNRQPMYDHNLIYYGCNLLGMSESDVANILLLLVDLSDFEWIIDRLHQGLVNHVVLQRAMEQRFSQLPEIKERNIVISADEHFYSGISQGGIYGPSVVALSPYITRGHLGVPGTNYAQLISRSKNFDEFYAIFDGAYVNRMDQAIALEAVHTLWVQGDSVSWYRRLKADPVDSSITNEVLLTPAKGDIQVAVITSETIARTPELGVAVMENYDQERTVSLTEETPYPHQGSGIVLYNYGNPWPPPGNLSPDKYVGHDPGTDPHGYARSESFHNFQMAHFFRTGTIIDVCGGDGCTPD